MEDITPITYWSASDATLIVPGDGYTLRVEFAAPALSPVHHDIPDNCADHCPLLIGAQLVVRQVGLVDFQTVLPDPRDLGLP